MAEIRGKSSGCYVRYQVSSRKFFKNYKVIKRQKVKDTDKHYKKELIQTNNRHMKEMVELISNRRNVNENNE